jgi:hypothetical protein
MSKRFTGSEVDFELEQAKGSEVVSRVMTALANVQVYKCLSYSERQTFFYSDEQEGMLSKFW